MQTTCGNNKIHFKFLGKLRFMCNIDLILLTASHPSSSFPFVSVIWMGSSENLQKHNLQRGKGFSVVPILQILFFVSIFSKIYEFSLSLNLHFRHVKKTVWPSSADLNCRVAYDIFSYPHLAHCLSTVGPSASKSSFAPPFFFLVCAESSSSR